MNKWIRHGDVIIEEVSEIKGMARKAEMLVLAEGEITGHKHVLTGKAITVSEIESQKYFEIGEEATLTHEEHDTLVIPSGKYRYFIQRETDLLQDKR